jgi:thymidine phosphorylase
MIPQEIIVKKRDGGSLSEAEIVEFVAGLTDGRVADAQAAAFAMAVFFRDLDEAECAALARAMTQSGRVLDWRRENLAGPVLDKHSTGGIGDLVSLVLAPMAAACGAFVPMIAGRGLGHTGGTIDKLEAIPGYDAAPDEARFRRTVREAGCAIIGQTGELAPADRRLYAIRDVTGTVESIPLIVASILSKKLSAGLQGLVMDVKTGSGAFMRSKRRAQDLARRLAGVADQAGLPTVCLITDMSQPLAPAAGNALETLYAIELLTGDRREPRVERVCVALVAEMLLVGGLCAAREEAAGRALEALRSGAAAERFARMAQALGGPADLVQRPRAYLPEAQLVRDVSADEAGYVCDVDARALGMAVVALGGGRRHPHDAIDPAVGLDRIVRVGDKIERGALLARAHAGDADAAAAACAAVRQAIRIGPTRPRLKPVILERLAPGERRD